MLPRLAALAVSFLLAGAAVAQAAPKIEVHFIAGHGETWTEPDPNSDTPANLGPFAANAPIPLVDTAYGGRKPDANGSYGPAGNQNKLQWSWILNGDPTRTVDDINQNDPGCQPWLDKTGAGYTNYPASCPWPAITKIDPGTTNTLITSGDQNDFQLDNPSSGIATLDATWLGNVCADDSGDNGAFALPIDGCLRPGKHHYMLSVQADGYEVAGGYFDYDPNSTADHVDVYMPLSANPLPLATYRTDVFFDMSGTNAEYDRDPETPPADGSGNIVAGVTTTTTDADGNVTARQNGLIPEGFVAKITDIMGEAITQNAYGDPICTQYKLDTSKPQVDGLYPYLLDANGDPQIEHPGGPGRCVSDANGNIIIRDLEPNRYSVTVAPPDNGILAVDTALNGTHTYHRIPVADPDVHSAQPGALELSQTTTLEGSHDWDQWLLAGDSGLDAELTNGSEKVSPVFSGWAVYDPNAQNNGLDNYNDARAVKKRVPAAALPDASVGLPQGSIHGFAHNAYSYSADPVSGNILGATDALQQDAGPQKHLWLALTDLTNGDATIFAAPFYNDKGEYTITGIPAGDYLLSYWDFDQLTIMEAENVTVTANHRTEVETLRMPQWWTKIEGTVFNDENGNGKQDPGEPGIPGLAVTLRDRTNNLFEQGSNFATTDLSGHYELIGAYPLGQWTVLEQYEDNYKTTGVTYQGSNDPNEHTIIGPGVDINVFNFIGQGHRIDWAKQPYSANENGGIVGSVSSGTTRNEQDPREAAIEDWQPGIPGMDVHLYKPLPKVNGKWQYNSDGTIAVEPGIDQTPYDFGPTYTTEEWQRPTDCQPLDGVGNPVFYPFMAGWDGFAGSDVQPSNTSGHECVESFSDGPIVGWDGADPSNFGGTTVNGNFGLATTFEDPAAANALSEGDRNALPDCGEPHDANLCTNPIAGDADWVVKVQVPTDVRGNDLWQPTREEDINVFTGDSVTQPQVALPDCAGKSHLVDLMGVGNDTPSAYRNPAFRDQGGSRYEGQTRHDCDEKVLHLDQGRSIAPLFEFMTPVQMPGIHWGLLIDDLSQSVDPTQVLYGDNAPGANLPINWYDWSHRFVRGTVADPDGFYEVMLPSSNRINAPTPSGVSPQVYTLVANDQATFDTFNHARPNPDYNPGFRTIAAAFQLYPGDAYGTDLALTPTSTNVFSPATQQVTVAACLVDTATPQIFAVNRPFVVPGAGVTDLRTIDVKGIGFGAAPTVTLTPSAPAPTVAPVSDAEFTLTFASNFPAGAYNIAVSNAGKVSTNGITLHVLGSGYSPNVASVDSQAALSGAITGNVVAQTPTLTDSGSPGWTAGALKGLYVQLTDSTTTNGARSQIRRITTNTANQLTLSANWTTAPAGSLNYVITGMGAVASGSTSSVINVTGTTGGYTPGGLVGDTLVLTRNDGTPTGQSRPITANTATQITVSPGFTAAPSTNGNYRVILPGGVIGTGSVTASGNTSLTDTANLYTLANVTGGLVIPTSGTAMGKAGTITNYTTGTRQFTVGPVLQPVTTPADGNFTTTWSGNPPVGSAYTLIHRTGAGTASNPATNVLVGSGFGAPGSKIGWRVDVTTGTNVQSRTVSMNTATTLTLNAALSNPQPTSSSTYKLYPFAAVQDAVDYAEQNFSSNRLVAVFPGATDSANPTGSYQENLIINRRLKLQGVGPGGTYPRNYAAIPALQGQSVLGADLNGWGFSVKTTPPTFAPESYATDWYTRIAGLTWDGNQTVADGETIYVLAHAGEFSDGGTLTATGLAPSFQAQIDGFTVEGGDNFDFPGTINPEGGGPLPPGGNEIGQPVAQGGGIYLNAYARFFKITNNVIKSNSGSFGGGIRVGTPALGDTGNDSSHNEGVLISNNQLLRNGGANLAGSIGLFNGSDNYHITQNMICGNYSAEYGAGISVYGMSPNGTIDYNRVRFNQSYDEGAGIIIAGQLPSPKIVPNQPPQGVSPGTGPQTINANVIQENIAGDDGGGLRFLMSGSGNNFKAEIVAGNQIRLASGGTTYTVASVQDNTHLTLTGTYGGATTTAAIVVRTGSTGAFRNVTGTVRLANASNAVVGTGFTVTNNMIVNNISAHEGGGIAIDDATDVHIVNNTIAKNITTATAMTSNGSPAPAGLSTGKLSTGVDPGYPHAYAQPELKNDIFFDNRAGSYAGGDVTGIGAHPGSSDVGVHNWDFGTGDGSDVSEPLPISNSIFATAPWQLVGAGTLNKTNVDPLFVDPYDASVRLSPFRSNPVFIGGVVVATNLPASLHDYHIQPGSPAIDAGSATGAPTTDIDTQPRPNSGGTYDMGADEVSTAAGTIVVATNLVRSIHATVVVRPAGTAAGRFIPGSRVTRTITAGCKDCTATITIKRGHSVRNLKYAGVKGRFDLMVKHLKPGRYHVRVTVTSRSMGTVYRSAWRTVNVKRTSKHGKGKR
jgi:hypothetical protein